MKISGRNKWKLYLAMKRNKELRPYLVHTKKWNKKNFERMLSKNKSIVVKPNKGLKAKNIYFIFKRNSKSYVVQLYENKIYFSSRQRVYEYMKKRINNTSYIIQKRIKMAKIDGRLFDIRVILQRKSINLPWEATAHKVRVAKKGRMVTNASKGGNILSFDEAMNQSNISNEEKGYLLDHIKDVSILAANALNRYYPKKRLYGIDIGIKKDGSLHIFEINRKPSLKGFTDLQEQRLKEYKEDKR
ncbi:YheC/YheD family protein [Alteribacillus bidgolensis]|uniref:YheC/D like ATP-grasp n=1 Tax=Alteribacillus bidgolensis TaxID=930129 RepID=A0A1G8D7H4_9BACI|nr:YheC/YheD family protein [Alteribacillus bidgolensis]SDH53230.1 YheC/D like ATP-grasp [Alteribacillus bidgolensis]